MTIKYLINCQGRASIISAIAASTSISWMVGCAVARAVGVVPHPVDELADLPAAGKALLCDKRHKASVQRRRR